MENFNSRNCRFSLLPDTETGWLFGAPVCVTCECSFLTASAPQDIGDRLLLVKSARRMSSVLSSSHVLLRKALHLLHYSNLSLLHEPTRARLLSLVLLIVMWSFVCPTKTHSNCSIKSLINERLGSCLPTKLYHFLEHYLFELLDSATSCPHHSLPLYSFHPLVLEFEWARTEDSRGAALAEPWNDHFCLDSGHIWMIYTWQAN